LLLPLFFLFIFLIVLIFYILKLNELIIEIRTVEVVVVSSKARSIRKQKAAKLKQKRFGSL